MSRKQDKEADNNDSGGSDLESTDDGNGSLEQALPDWTAHYNRERNRRIEAERREKAAKREILKKVKSKLDNFYNSLCAELLDDDDRAPTTTTTTSRTSTIESGTSARGTHDRSAVEPTNSKKKAPRPSEIEPDDRPVKQRFSNGITTTTMQHPRNGNGTVTTTTTAITRHMRQNGNGSSINGSAQALHVRSTEDKTSSPEYPRKFSPGSISTAQSETHNGAASHSSSKKKKPTASTSEKDAVNGNNVTATHTIHTTGTDTDEVSQQPSKESVEEFIEEEKKSIVRLLRDLPRTPEEDVLKIELEQGLSTYRISDSMKRKYGIVKGVLGTQARSKRQNFNILLHGVRLTSANLNDDPRLTNFEDPRDASRALVEIQQLLESYLRNRRVLKKSGFSGRKDEPPKDSSAQKGELPAEKQKRLRLGTLPRDEGDVTQSQKTKTRSSQRQSARKASEKLAELGKVKEYNLDELQREHEENRPVGFRDPAAQEELQAGTITQKKVSYRKNPNSWQLREIDTCNLNLSQVRLKPVDGEEAAESADPDDVYLLEDIGVRDGKSVCISCGQMEPEENRKLMKCKGCGCAYHYTCHCDIDDSLDPNAHWLCDFCTEEARAGPANEGRTSDTDGCGPSVRFRSRRRTRSSRTREYTDETDEEEEGEQSSEDEEEPWNTEEEDALDNEEDDSEEDDGEIVNDEEEEY